MIPDRKIESMLPLYIDSHAHLDFYNSKDLAEIVQKMRTAQTMAISIGTQSEDWKKIADIASKAPEVVAGYTVGIHPSKVKENWREEIRKLEEFLESYLLSNNSPTGIVGVGECGLDYYRLNEAPNGLNNKNNATDTVKYQKAAFEAQLSIVKNLHSSKNLSIKNLPVIIHSRGAGAFADIVHMIDKSGNDWSKFVFHCFSEGPAEIRDINARGARGSFTGIITFKNGEQMRQAMLAQGPEKIMIETDAPFLSPEPFRGQPNDPSRVGLVAKKAAELLGMSVESLGQLVLKNTKEFFGI